VHVAGDDAGDAVAGGDLAERRAVAGIEPDVVALHHPPIATGMPFLDDIGLDPGDGAALGEITARHRVARIVAGHVHMTAQGLLGATPVLTCPSTWRLRARLRLGAPGYEIEDAPAGFALHVLTDGGLTSHVVSL